MLYEDAYFVDVDILGVLSINGSAVAGHITEETLNDLTSFRAP